MRYRRKTKFIEPYKQLPAPVKVEIPGFAKAMPNAKVVERTKLDEVEVDTFDKDKFDLAHLAKEMMERRKRLVFSQMSSSLIRVDTMSFNDVPCLKTFFCDHALSNIF